MKTLQKILIASAVAIMGMSSSFAQKGIEDGSKYGHGEDSIRCLRNYSLYREYVKNKGYSDGLPFWRIVYTECPLISKNVFIDGVEIYEDLIDNAESQEQKELYIDTLMQVYDKRIEYFDEKGFVIGRKGVFLWKYRREKAEDIQEAMEYMKQSIDLRKTSTEPAVIATYFTAVITLYKAGVFEDTRVVSEFSELNRLVESAIEKHQRNARTVSYYQQVKEANEKNFIGSGAATCESIVAEYEPKFDENQSDKEFLTNLTGMLTQVNCESTDLYAKAAEKLYAIEPSPDAAYKLAKLLVKREEYTKAAKYYKQAADGENDPEKKAGYLYEQAIIQAQLNNKVQARSLAREALNLKPNWGDPYIFIGKLYAGSVNECGNDEFERNAVYWVVVDKFIRAKAVDESVTGTANDLISQYSQYFPNKEEGFFRNIHVGDSYTVGCWINETTTVRY